MADSSEVKKSTVQPIEIHVDLSKIPVSSDSTQHGAREATSATNTVQEMPTVTTLLRRKKLGSQTSSGEAAAEPIPSETPKPTTPLPPAPGNVVTVVNSEIAITQQDNTWTSMKVDEKVQHEVPDAHASNTSGASVARTPGVVPPPFAEKLFLDPIDLKRFPKELRAHRKSVKLKKLDCLGFLSTRFEEIAYFATVPTGALAGTMGFGSPELVSGARKRVVTPEKFPALFEIVSQGTCLIGSIEQFRAEDQQVLHGIGLRSTAMVGIFPVLKKKKLLGVWVCGARSPVEFSPKELKTITKIFADLQL